MLEQMKTEFNPFTTRVLLCFMFMRDYRKDVTVQTYEKLSILHTASTCGEIESLSALVTVAKL